MQVANEEFEILRSQFVTASWGDESGLYTIDNR